MTIKYANHTICAENEEVSNFALNLKRLVLSDNLIDCSKIFLRDKKNESLAVSFEVEKSYKTVPLANRAAFEFPQTISGASSATLEFVFDPQKPSDKISLENVALTKCRAVADSRIVRFHFEFSQGELY